MRDQLYEFDRYFVAIRLGFDAHIAIDTPKLDESRDLLPMLPMLIEHGLDAPPYRRWTPDGRPDERRSLSIVSTFLGTDGSIVVYKKRSIAVSGVPTDGVSLSNEEAVNVITNGIYALTETDDLEDENGEADAGVATDNDITAHGDSADGDSKDSHESDDELHDPAGEEG